MTDSMDTSSGRTVAAATLRGDFAWYGETGPSREGWSRGVTERELTAMGSRWRRCSRSAAPRPAMVPRRHKPAAAPPGDGPSGRRAARSALTVQPARREIDHGAWEDLPAAEVAARDAVAFTAWHAHPGWRGAPGGESGYAVAAPARRR